MFKLNTEETFKTPVEITVPSSSGTGIKKKFLAEFRFKTQSELDALVVDGNGTDAALLNEVLVGWVDFKDATGETIEYTEENKSQAIDTPFIRVALVQAFVQSINGVQNRTKN